MQDSIDTKDTDVKCWTMAESFWLQPRDNPWFRAAGSEGTPNHGFCMRKGARFSTMQKEWRKARTQLSKEKDKYLHAKELLPVVNEFVPLLQGALENIKERLSNNDCKDKALKEQLESCLKQENNGPKGTQQFIEQEMSSLALERQFLQRQHDLTYRHYRNYQAQRPLLFRTYYEEGPNKISCTKGKLLNLQHKMNQSIAECDLVKNLAI